jgi:hypothetical protein
MHGHPQHSDMNKDLGPLGRLPLLVLGMLSLVGGVLGGLARLGVAVPDIAAAQAAGHSALMIGAFFGTVISLERAVAIGRSWAYTAPASAGLGGVLLLAGAPMVVVQGLLTLSALVLTLGCMQVMMRQTALFTIMLGVGGLCLLAGNVLWLAGVDIHALTPWWLAFLVLTIAGERLELTRFLPVRPAAPPLFIAAAVVILSGAVVTLWRQDAGLRVFAAGLLALALWLLRYDIARHNARQSGLARFIAICLLSGYIWLALGAALGLTGGYTPGHPLRDAAIHMIALGFVFAMVFGHAPIIFPAVMRVRIPYHPFFYVPLLVLHGSLMLRVGGVLSEHFFLRQHGAMANAAALAVFILTMLTSVIRNRKRMH